VIAATNLGDVMTSLRMSPLQATSTGARVDVEFQTVQFLRPVQVLEQETNRLFRGGRHRSESHDPLLTLELAIVAQTEAANPADGCGTDIQTSSTRYFLSALLPADGPSLGAVGMGLASLTVSDD